MMQAMAEGFDILKNAGTPKLAEGHRFAFDLADVAEVWRRGSVVTSWLLDLTAAGARPRRRALGLLRPCRGFGRGPLDRDGGGRGGGAGRGAHRRALRPLPLAPGAHLRREGALGDAPGLRRPCRAEEADPSRAGTSAAAPEKAAHEAGAAFGAGADGRLGLRQEHDRRAPRRPARLAVPRRRTRSIRRRTSTR